MTKLDVKTLKTVNGGSAYASGTGTAYASGKNSVAFGAGVGFAASGGKSKK